ncbi:hypothetical protein [Photobacterium minamisatsumaniensis]|uniref:hypothetical protein n=1 Tax=Photobacterium minamisatsumaniensis TaxID=2910233 RepID=UPI003D0FAFF8
MKGLLIIIATLTSASVAAVPSDYDSCLHESDSKVCQAYLAGLNQGKASMQVAAIEPVSTFRSRALEQRVGERSRRMVSVDKKAVSSAE